MVESSPHKYNFLKLNLQELINKLALAIQDSTKIVFWKHNPRYYEGHLISHQYSPNNLRVVLKFDFLPVQMTDFEICLNFSLNEVEYFIKAKVLLQNEDEKVLELIIQEPAYRVEKRLQERILTYPRYQCFLYIRYEKYSPEENVLFLNKKDTQENAFFKKLSMKNSIQTENDDEEVYGLRIEDINADGLAGISSVTEYEEILKSFKDKTFSAVLMFETKSFTLAEIKMVYAMDYISPYFNNIKMKKLGFSFKHSASLKRELEDLTGTVLELTDYRNEFEEFIKNE